MIINYELNGLKNDIKNSNNIEYVSTCLTNEKKLLEKHDLFSIHNYMTSF